MLRGVELALDGRAFDRLLPPTGAWLDQMNGHLPADDNLFRLRVRFNHGEALMEAHARLADPKRPDADKVKLIQLLGQVRRPESLPVLLDLFRAGKSDAVRGAALTAAQSYGDPKVSDELLATFPKLAGGLRQQAIGILLSRPATALAVLQQVDAKKLDPKSIPVEQLRPVLDFKDEKIETLVEKHFGKLAPATAGEKQARIALAERRSSARGPATPARGKVLFTKHCAACHTLHGEGGKVGPDLTTADRKNRDYLLAQIVDPSGYIRPEFVTYNVLTQDDRKLSGIATDSTGESSRWSTSSKNKVVKTTVAKADIEEMLPSAGVADAGEAARHAQRTGDRGPVRVLCRANAPSSNPNLRPPLPGRPERPAALRQDPANPRRQPGGDRRRS